MKKQRRKIILFVLIFVILCIILFQNKKNQNYEFQDELIFFKWFSFGKNKTENIFETENSIIQTNQTIQTEQESQFYQQYSFHVSYKNIDFKEIYLSDTINKETLIYEKIAPGTKGAFEILLETNEKISYQIKFESKNSKPENLSFHIEGKDRKYKNLEDMEQDLQGEISENKSIVIYWEWEYEQNEIQDLQDTKDGETIQQYNFTIYAIGQ